MEDSLAFPLIQAQAALGCAKCALVSEAVLTLMDDEVSIEDTSIGWDIKRIQGLRILVSHRLTGCYLFGIDLFGTTGIAYPRIASSNCFSAFS